jgi:hypothetical protein
MVPSAGTLVQLVRGELIVHGLVAWSVERQCGLKFSGRVDTQRWCAPPANLEQQRVDEVARLVKAGAVPLPVAAFDRSNDRNEGPTDARFSADLRRVSALLDRLGDVLAGDPRLVSRFGPALQNLDIAMQVIAALEAIVTGHGDVDDDDGAKLAGLRRSADQALQRAG